MAVERRKVKTATVLDIFKLKNTEIGWALRGNARILDSVIKTRYTSGTASQECIFISVYFVKRINAK